MEAAEKSSKMIKKLDTNNGKLFISSYLEQHESNLPSRQSYQE